MEFERKQAAAKTGAGQGEVVDHIRHHTGNPKEQIMEFERKKQRQQEQGREGRGPLSSSNRNLLAEYLLQQPQKKGTEHPPTHGNRKTIPPRPTWEYTTGVGLREVFRGRLPRESG